MPPPPPGREADHLDGPGLRRGEKPRRRLPGAPAPRPERTGVPPLPRDRLPCPQPRRAENRGRPAPRPPRTVAALTQEDPLPPRGRKQRGLPGDGPRPARMDRPAPGRDVPPVAAAVARREQP